jgi:DNA-binding MarR family transcriptional regulator
MPDSRPDSPPGPPSATTSPEGRPAQGDPGRPPAPEHPGGPPAAADPGRPPVPAGTARPEAPTDPAGPQPPAIPRRQQATTIPRPLQAPTIKDLLSYRIHQLANALSRGAAARYRREFDVSLMEWRVIALLGDFAPMTLKTLARQAGLDKGLASRVVSGLVGRGLVRRDPGADAREVALRLTPAGGEVFEGLMRSAGARDAAFRAALTAEEAACLEGAIAKLVQAARDQG